eukprot:Hpha_TRINITY_DN15987_c2_g11::TRINITY_DN15987_c2_g11_i1::g.72340::m.72340
MQRAELPTLEHMLGSFRRAEDSKSSLVTVPLTGQSKPLKPVAAPPPPPPRMRRNPAASPAPEQRKEKKVHRQALMTVNPKVGVRKDVKQRPVAPPPKKEGAKVSRSELPTLAAFVFPPKKVHNLAEPIMRSPTSGKSRDLVMELSVEDYFLGGTTTAKTLYLEEEFVKSLRASLRSGEAAEAATRDRGLTLDDGTDITISSDEDILERTQNNLLASVARSDADALAQSLKGGKLVRSDTLRLSTKMLTLEPDQVEDCDVLEKEGFRSSVRDIIFGGGAQVPEEEERVLSDAIEIIRQEMQNKPPPGPKRKNSQAMPYEDASPSRSRFGRNAKVEVVVSPEELERLSYCHGGWGGPDMAKCCGVEGVVSHVFRNGDVFVRFPSMSVSEDLVEDGEVKSSTTLWRLHPKALRRVVTQSPCWTPSGSRRGSLMSQSPKACNRRASSPVPGSPAQRAAAVRRASSPVRSPVVSPSRRASSPVRSPVTSPRRRASSPVRSPVASPSRRAS